MNTLVEIKWHDAFTNSMSIAEGTGLQHKSVIRLIQKQSQRLRKFGELRFSDLKSTNPQGGRPTKICYLNEQQATLLITFMDNTEDVADFKVRLVGQFYAMKKILLERATNDWLEERRVGKLTRKEETSIIQQLVEYAKGQGSEHSEKLYVVYTKLANTMAGISNRDLAPCHKLCELNLIENIILNQIANGMEAGQNYKEIYQCCKRQIETFKHVAYLGG